jgi:selenocysteine-specific elongation factor
MADAPLTLGTAGHIDHGKTTLVRALTGVDTDRLPEERKRGISIALGYAALDLPSGRRLSVVDVPGHERFVRTMVAGATGIDLFLLVVAADDGIMPQTREHLAVLRALGVDIGVVAVTKTDLAPPPALEGLGDAEVVPVSAPTGEGLDALRGALDRAAARASSRAAQHGPLRLHVDRSFSVHGAGTVVTGTLWSGRAARGDEVVVLPAGRRARVRSVQVHDAAVEDAAAGQRVALNLAGLARDEVRRGDVVTAAGDAAAPAATYRVDARLVWDPPGDGARVMVHHGTREAPARAVELGDGVWQLRLEAPIVALAGDRVVLRSIAPPDTLGGGVIVAVAPRRRRTLAAPEPVQPAAPEPVPAAAPALAPLDASALETEAELRTLSPPADAELPADDLAALRAHGRAVRVGPAQHFHADVLADVEARLVALLEAEGSVTLARVRDELGSSRRYVQALLEHFDSERLTLRRGDERVLRRRRG